jgi:hypothetical protein
MSNKLPVTIEPIATECVTLRKVENGISLREQDWASPINGKEYVFHTAEELAEAIKVLLVNWGLK